MQFMQLIRARAQEMEDEQDKLEVASNYGHTQTDTLTHTSV